MILEAGLAAGARAQALAPPHRRGTAADPAHLQPAGIRGVAAGADRADPQAGPGTPRGTTAESERAQRGLELGHHLSSHQRAWCTYDKLFRHDLAWVPRFSLELNIVISSSMSSIRKLKSQLATFSIISKARKLKSLLVNRIQQLGLGSQGTYPANYGITRYYFYDHTKNGKDAINPLSRFADPGIRKHLQKPLQIRNQAIQDILKNLTNTGISKFHINTLANGSDIFQNVCREIAVRQSLEYEEIRKWQDDSTDRLAKLDSGKGSFRYDFKLEPNLGLPCWQLATHPDILSIINSYLSSYCRIYFAEYWLSIPLPDKVQGPLPNQLWHRDGYGTVVKLFLYLNDVNIENGAFWYAAGTDKGPSRNIHGSKYRLEDDEMASLFGRNISIIPANAKAGDIVLANTSAYHKGGFVQRGSRLLFTASYFCPWTQELDAHKSLIPVPERDTIQDLHPAQIFALGLDSN